MCQLSGSLLTKGITGVLFVGLAGDTQLLHEGHKLIQTQMKKAG